MRLARASHACRATKKIPLSVYLLTLFIISTLFISTENLFFIKTEIDKLICYRGFIYSTNNYLEDLFQHFVSTAEIQFFQNPIAYVYLFPPPLRY